jgi:hypothetical protein
VVAEEKPDVLHSAVALDFASQITLKCSSAARESTPNNASVANARRERKDA